MNNQILNDTILLSVIGGVIEEIKEITEQFEILATLAERFPDDPKNFSRTMSFFERTGKKITPIPFPILGQLTNLTEETK